MIQRDPRFNLTVHSGVVRLPDVPYQLNISDELLYRSLREGPEVLLRIVENEAHNITQEVLDRLPTEDQISEHVYFLLAEDLKDVYQTLR